MQYRVPGKIFTASVSNLKKITHLCDEVWLITRAGTDISGTIRVRWLSPGPELYKDYLDKWKDTDPEEWWSLYKSRFEEELKLPERRATLRKLWALLSEGKNIGLLCFCPDYKYCHRTIIGDLLANQGVFVEEISPPKMEKPAGQYIQEAFIFG